MDEATYRKVIEEEPWLADKIHFVARPCKNGEPGYYRRIPVTYKNREARPVSQLEPQLALAKSSFESFGKRGFKDGVPIVAAINKEALKGKRYKPPKWKEVVKKLKESLREVVIVVEEKAVSKGR